MTLSSFSLNIMATEWEVFYLKNWSYEDIAGTSKFPHFHPFSDTPAHFWATKTHRKCLSQTMPNVIVTKQNHLLIYIYTRYFDTWNRVSIHLVLHIEQQDPHIGSISYNFGWFWFCGFVLAPFQKFKTMCYPRLI